MTKPFLTLFLAGAFFGGVFVLSYFLCRAVSDRRENRARITPKKKKQRLWDRGKAVIRFVLDFVTIFAAGAYLVLYDATVLGGRGRLFHLVVFLIGGTLVRLIFQNMLFRPTERVVTFVFDSVIRAFSLFLLPVRKCFSLVFTILFRLYLILKRKNDKMRRKKQAKRQIARLHSMMDGAFLPAAVTEAIASGRD